MTEPTFCVVDDLRFDTLGPGEVSSERAYGFTAYIVSDSALHAVTRLMEDAKEAVGLHRADPIKRAMDDEIRRHYVRRYNRKAKEKFDLAKRKRWTIARDGLDALVSEGGKVFACLAWPYSAAPSSEELLGWAFTNLMDRVAITTRLAARDRGFSLYVLADRPSDGLLLPYEDLVRNARRYGASLGDRGACDTLLTAATPHSTPLQLADFVSSLCRDFLSWCHSGKKERDAQRFLRIASALGCRPDGTVHNIGIKVQPDPGFEIDAKIAELSAS
ncbi:MAG: hypothetical protein WAT66_14060 [Actinomycetota bacterium]